MAAQQAGNRQGHGMIQHGEEALRRAAEGLAAATGAGDHQLAKVEAVEINESGTAVQTVRLEFFRPGKAPFLIYSENQPQRNMRTVCF